MAVKEKKKLIQKGDAIFTGNVTVDPTKFKDDAGNVLGLQRYVDVTITTGQVLALNGTPKQIVAAPGAGLYVHFHSAIIFMDYNSIAYSGVAAGENLAFCYTDLSGAQVAVVETDPFLTLTADATIVANALAASGGFVPVANAALVLGLLTGEIAAGNSPLKVRCYYSIRAMAF